MHELELHYGARSGGVSSKGSSVGLSRGSSGNTTPTSGQLLAMSFPRLKVLNIVSTQSILSLKCIEFSDRPLLVGN